MRTTLKTTTAIHNDDWSGHIHFADDPTIDDILELISAVVETEADDRLSWISLLEDDELIKTESGVVEQAYNSLHAVKSLIRR